MNQCCQMAKFDPLCPPTLHPGAIQGKEGIKFCHLATLFHACLCPSLFQDQKTKNLLAMERAREEEAAKEALLTASMANNKQKLLTDLAEEEAAREAQVRGLQQLKDREREGLFESLAQGKFSEKGMKNNIQCVSSPQSKYFVMKFRTVSPVG